MIWLLYAALGVGFLAAAYLIWRRWRSWLGMVFRGVTAELELGRSRNPIVLTGSAGVTAADMAGARAMLLEMPPSDEVGWQQTVDYLRDLRNFEDPEMPSASMNVYGGLDALFVRLGPPPDGLSQPDVEGSQR
jgi:hypothetical protein